MKFEEFIRIVKEETGLNCPGDFGFVIGAYSPFDERSQAFLSSSNINGYQILKMSKLGSINGKTKIIKPPYTDYKNLKAVIEFLNEKD